MEKPILEFPFCTADWVCLGILECLNYGGNRVLPGLFLIPCPDLLQNVLLCPFKGHPFQGSDCEQLWFEEYQVWIISAAISVVWTLWQSIWLSHIPFWAMVKREIKTREEQGPSSLSPVELLCCLEVFQVFVVCPDLWGMFCTFQEVALLLYSSNDCQHLLVIDIIILFHCAQGLEVEGHWVPLSIFLWELG